MQEIANGTFNYSTLNEIMPMIYKRFTEKTAEEWRQIYKALQLLEFLAKNGSERVIDDARSHLSLLKMLRQFHFIDQNGKDQGINVRNRAKELAELLGDVERIRAERKKARATRNKYGGVEGGAGMSSSTTASRYGGFGSEQPGGGYGGYSGGVYGDGGGFGGEQDSYETAQTQPHRERFEEYDEDDNAGSAAPSRKKGTAAAASSSASSKRAAAKKEASKPKEPEVDLFDFTEEDVAGAVPASNGAAAAPLSMPLTSAADEDDFDDFQSAAPPVAAPASQFSMPNPTSATTSTFGAISPPPSTTASATANYSAFSSPPTVASPTSQPLPSQTQSSFQPMRPAGYQAAQPNYYQSVSIGGNAAPSSGSSGVMSPTGSMGKTPSKPASGSDPFASLMAGAGSKKVATAQKGPALADMAKQKASAGIWGATATSTKTGQSNGGGDLLG